MLDVYAFRAHCDGSTFAVYDHVTRALYYRADLFAGSLFTAGFDGVPVLSVDGEAFLPATWLEKERPEFREFRMTTDFETLKARATPPPKGRARAGRA